MKNYIQPGDHITITAGSTVASGDVVQAGQLLGIATDDAVMGQTLTIKTTGVFRVPKATSESWTVGALVYWNGTAMTTTASTNTPAGCAVEAAGNDDTEGVVRLNGTAVPDAS